MKLSDFFQGVTAIDIQGPKIAFSFDVFGLTINVSESIILGWVLIFVLACVVRWLTHDLRVDHVSKRQAVAEWLVEIVHNLIDTNMGTGFRQYAPYIAALFTYSMFGSLISMLGLRSITADFNTVLAWGLITFVMIQYTKIRYGGLLNYIKGFFSPIFLMAPMNVLSEVSTPIAMGFRHFGNVAGGMVITCLIYYALTGLSNAVHLPIPLFTVGVPAVLSVYFDLFSGVMQAFIFSMLTMAYVSNARDAE